MKTKGVLMALLVLSLVLNLPGAAGAKSAGKGAFLIQHANTVQDLVDQIEESRLVALRYAKHFRTDPSTVLSYFRNELSVVELETTSTYEVYFLDESRNIVSETRELKAGTRVFANKSGVPILQIGTGNPLAATLPAPGGIPRLAEMAKGEVADGGVVVQVLEQPPTELAGGAAPGTTGAITGSLAEPGAVVAYNPEIPIPGPAGGTGTHMRSLSSWLLPLGLAGAAAALGGGGRGGVQSSPPPAQDGDQPVPEPAGLAALGSGMMALSGLLYRRRRH